MAFFFFFFEPYIAIIADIKNSKKIEDREIFQEKLKSVLNDVNQKYCECIASKFTITLGDEFQGLLTSAENIMEITQFIKKEIYPIKIRFGLGIGTISTKINPELSIGADGPGYHRARESIEYLKKVEKKKEKACVDIQIKIDDNNASQELVLNTMFKLMYSIEAKWTEKQREIIYYLLFEKVNQTEVSLHFNVSQSNIQQMLAKGHYYAFKEAFNTINILLGEVNYHNA